VERLRHDDDGFERGPLGKPPGEALGDAARGDELILDVDRARGLIDPRTRSIAP
jgi:hypothetical protein